MSIFEALGLLRHDTARALVAIVAIALGIGMGVTVHLAGESAVRAASSDLVDAASGVDLQIVRVGSSFDERLLARTLAQPGVQSVEPYLRGPVTARSGAVSETLQLVGVDLLRPPPGLGIAGESPGAFSAGGTGIAPRALVYGNAAIVSSAFAARHRLAVGQTFSVEAGGRRTLLRVARVGTGSQQPLDSSTLLVDVSTAQDALGKVGLLDRLDCAVDPARLRAASESIARTLPFNARLTDPESERSDVRHLVGAFALNLNLIVGVALLVAAALVFNTVSVSVLERRAEIATLRALGATRKAVFGTFLGEGALVGVVGSILGIGLGLLCSHLSSKYFGISTGQFVDTRLSNDVTSQAAAGLDVPAIVAAIGGGAVISALSAAVPALQAANTAPAGAMRAKGFDASASRSHPLLARFAMLSLAVGGGLAYVGVATTGSWAGYLAGAALIAGAVCAVRPAVQTLAHASRAATGRAAPALQMAIVNFGTAPLRTAIAISALMVAVGLTVGISVVSESLSQSVALWASDVFRGDLFVSPAEASDDSAVPGFTPRDVRAIRSLPNVSAVEASRATDIRYGGTTARLDAIEADAFAARAERAGAVRPVPAPTALISRTFAERFAVRAGDSLALPTPRGSTQLHVIAVVDDFSSQRGTIFITSGTYEALYDDASSNALAVVAASGADLTALRAQIARRLGSGDITIRSDRELRAGLLARFDGTFTILNAMSAVALAIAILGMGTALFTLIFERKTEIVLLPILGMRSRAIATMVVYEAGFIGAISVILGAILGGLLAVVLVLVVDPNAFGWTMSIHVPLLHLFCWGALLCAAALAGGLYPARDAARLHLERVK